MTPKPDLSLLPRSSLLHELHRSRTATIRHDRAGAYRLAVDEMHWRRLIILELELRFKGWNQAVDVAQTTQEQT